MKAEFFIILIGLIISAASLTHFIRRAITHSAKSAMVQASIIYQDKIDQLIDQINELTHLRKLDQLRFEDENQRATQELDELRKFKRESSTATLTKRDMQTLFDIVETLDMAHKTWLPVRGTEPWRAKAAAQVKQINILANRVLDSIRGEQSPVLIEQRNEGRAA